jgi:ABC-type dipeptide/oligopeptide/nickel transport system permease subunit
VSADTRSPGGDSWRRLRRDHAAMLGAACLLVLVLGAVAAPLVAPYEPTKVTMRERLQTPSARHLLGTDQFGRDILSRIVHGTRISLTIGLISVGIGLGLGTTLGLLAGFFRRLDYPIVAAMDVLLSFPQILLAIAIVAALGPGIFNAMIAVGIGTVPAFTRLTRATTLSIREREYVEAARAHGAGNARFLGLGAQPPMPEWGAMVAEGRAFIAQYPHIATFPSLAIFVVVLCFNLLGDGLRDALDPHLKD